MIGRRNVAVAFGLLLCLAQGQEYSVKSWKVEDLKDRKAVCASEAYGLNRNGKTLRMICDPEDLLKSKETVESTFDAFETSLDSGTVFDIKIGLVIVSSTESSLPKFATQLAQAWKLDGDDQALIVLSTEARDEHGQSITGHAGCFIAGGLLNRVGLYVWQSALEHRMAMILHSGDAHGAVESGISGLMQLLGGEPLMKDGKFLASTRESNPKQQTLTKYNTKFQSLDLQTNICGQERCKQLFLDDILQLSDRFEPFYHEAMALPALNALKEDARRVLILGGGDGGIATLALRFDTVEKVVLVDIDEAVTNVSKQVFPAVSAGFSDPRMTTMFGDGLKYVRDNQDQVFDLVIIDFSDTPLEGLWSEEFFEKVKNLLSPRGALVMNIGTALKDNTNVLTMLSKVFKMIFHMAMFAPDYYSPYLLAMCTQDLNPYTVDWKIWERQNIDTMYYSPQFHPHIFNVPSDVMQINNMEVYGEPVCAKPMTEPVHEDHLPVEIDELDHEMGTEIFSKKTQAGTTIKVFEHDPISRKFKFVPWVSEEVRCENRSIQHPCFRSLRSGVLSRADDLQGPVVRYFAEVMVMPAMNMLGPTAKRILVLGGGDGVMANLILEYPTVESLVIVEGDEVLARAVERFFKLGGAAFRSNKTEMVIQDAFSYLAKFSGVQFDAIFVNLAHNLMFKPSRYTRVPLSAKFLLRLHGMLKPKGLLVQDIGSHAAPRLALRRFSLHQAQFKHSWPLAFASLRDTYSASTDRQWRHSARLFVMSSKAARDPLDVNWRELDAHMPIGMYYHATLHNSLFIVPRELQLLFEAPPPHVANKKNLCGAPNALPAATTIAKRDAAASFLKLTLEGCKTVDVEFLDHITRFVSFPSYGSWLHDLGKTKSQGYATALMLGSFVNIEYSKDTKDAKAKATLTLVCRKTLCEGLQEKLRQAIDKQLECKVVSKWKSISPVTWQHSKKGSGSKPKSEL